MITRFALAAAKSFKKHTGFFAGAAAKFRDEDGRRQFGNDFVGILSKETALGAGDAVLRKMADDFEKRGTYGVIQIFRRNFFLTVFQQAVTDISSDSTWRRGSGSGDVG